MQRKSLTQAAWGLAAACAATAPALLGAAPQGESSPARKAVEKAVPLIERSAEEYTRRRGCFSCHHQTLPVLALTAARAAGVAVDADRLKKQVEFTEASLRGGRDNYRQGRGQGGQADTAGYALLALDVGGWTADETTAAAAEYLLLRDAAMPNWRATSNRPPSETSAFTTTYLALRALRKWATPEQKERVDGRVARAREWLLAAQASDTEDRVFRLRALAEAGAAPEALKSAAEVLLAAQREDGGWSQTAELASDAYATGSALAALREVGGTPVGDPAYRKGARFLIGTQEADGSWRVQTRSRPIQTYFETGFPHGKDQFISIAATCWAVAALAPIEGP